MNSSKAASGRQIAANIGVMTYNMAGLKPNANFDLSQFVLPGDTFSAKESPDFYVVGLQEMVPLTVMGSLTCYEDKQRMA